MYTKLFSSLTDSTIWREPDPTRILWITMLSMADKHGDVMASVPGLADRARLSMEKTLEGLASLSKPDEWSRSQDHEGRRIKEIGGGWNLLNYSIYSKFRSADERRSYMREYMKDRRKQTVNKVSEVSRQQPQLAHTDVDTHTNTSKSKALAQLSLSDCESIFKFYPRKVGKVAALPQIKKAIERLIKGEYEKTPMTHEQAVAGLKGRTQEFADSPAGKKGIYTPHPATWFSAGRYLDNPKEWSEEDGRSNPTKRDERIEQVSKGREAILAGLGISPQPRPGDAGVQDRTSDGGSESMENLLEGRKS